MWLIIPDKFKFVHNTIFNVRFHNCGKCKKYKFIKNDGLCKKCYENSQNVSNKIFKKCKTESKSNIPLNIFKNSKTINNRCILGSFNKTMNILAGLEILRMKRIYNDLNVYCLDNTGILSNFINKLSGNVHKSKNTKEEDLFDPKYLDLKNTNNLSIDIRNNKVNDIVIASILNLLSRHSNEKTIVYFDAKIGRDYTIKSSLSISTSYNTSINLIYENYYPSSKIIGICPISRIHYINNQNLSDQLDKTINPMEKRHITTNPKSYANEPNQNVIIKRPDKNDYFGTSISVSKSEQRLIKSI